MSGGSYNYLRSATDLEDLLAKRRDLTEMYARLQGLPEDEFPGATAAARATGRLVSLLRTWEDHATVSIDMLRDVWHAIEWWDSMDWGPDQVQEALVAYVEPQRWVYGTVGLVKHLLRPGRIDVYCGAPVREKNPGEPDRPRCDACQGWGAA